MSVSSGSWGKNSEIQASAKETERLNEKIYDILADNSSRSRSWFERKIEKRGRSDWFLEPEKATSIGLADHIGMPKLQIKVEVEIDLI